MRAIQTDQIIESVKNLCIKANFELGQPELEAIERAIETEESPIGVDILKQIAENARIARDEQVPLCQDTGFAIFFLELGQAVRIEGGTLSEAIAEGVRQGYEEGYLRKSILGDPLERVNTGDNTPPIIHTEVVEGDQLKITFDAKGGGSENMSRLQMLKPADGEDGVKDFVVETVRLAGANPCPPIIVGVGIGGNFEVVAKLAKKSLIRPLGSANPDPKYAAMESELLERINNLGIGPQGLGGRTTALSVHITAHPCHIASLPVAVNIECHSHRHKSVVL
jgi:fumarate hydratase subunit alpha